MGWLTSYNWDNKKDVQRHVVENCFVGWDVEQTSEYGSEFYITAKHPTKPSDIVCFVYLIRKYDDNYGYKDMDCSMHPYYYNCPERMLKTITLDDENTKNWIAECRRIRKAKSKWRGVFNKLKNGDRILVNGDSEYTFCYMRKGSPVLKNANGVFYYPPRVTMFWHSVEKV